MTERNTGSLNLIEQAVLNRISQGENPSACYAVQGIDGLLSLRHDAGGNKIQCTG